MTSLYSADVEHVKGGMNRQNMKDVQGSDATLHDKKIMDTRYTFFKTHRMHNTKTES